MPKALLFFTTANPPTGDAGQVGLVNHFTKDYDDVYVIPTQTPKERPLADYQHRVNMSRLAFEDLSPNVRVQEWAKEMENASLLSLIESVKEKTPNTKLSVLFGSDALTQFVQETSPPTPAPSPLPEQGEASVSPSPEPDEVCDAEVVATATEEAGSKASSKASTPVPTIPTPTPPTPISLEGVIDSIVVVQRAGFPQHTFTDTLYGVSVGPTSVASLRATSSTALASSIDPNFLINSSKHNVLRYLERRRLYAFCRSKMQKPKPAIILNRNPTIDATAKQRTEASRLEPKHFLSDASPLLHNALCEMLKREVEEDPLTWLAQYLKLNKNKPVVEEDEASNSVTASTTIVDSLTAQLTRLFKSIDADNSGEISRKELTEKLGADGEVQKLLSDAGGAGYFYVLEQLDSEDGDGVITLAEFLATLKLKD